MTENVLVTRDAGVMEITFNRPEKKNALTRAMYAEVVDALRSADADPAVRVAILTGSGDIFTSNDSPASPFLTALSTMQTPLIGAVNGAAIGVGTTMLAHCDLIVASRSARFVMPFTSLGLVPEAGSSLLFPRLLGNQRASALLLLGEPLTAETALEWGFVNQVVEPEALMDTARGFARRMAVLPPQAVRQTKQLIRHGAPDVTARIAEELVLFRERLSSPEAGEAFAAFVEKRKPDFSRFE